MKLSDIKGVGPKVEQNLATKGILTVKNLLEFYPINYELYTKSNAKVDKAKIKIKGTITRDVSEYRPRSNLLVSTYFVHDGIDEVKVVAWNQKHLRFTFKKGDSVEVYGTYDSKRQQLTQSTVHIIDKNDLNLPVDVDFKDENIKNDEIIPIYSKVTKIANIKLHKIIMKAISMLDESEYKEALLKVHNPKNFKDINEGKEYLKYVEFKEYYLKLKELEKNQKLTSKDYIKNIVTNDLNKIYAKLSFALTEDQETVINSIIGKLKSEQKTQTLVLGDVGSGKTVVMIIIAELLVRAGYQVAIMAPTEILARQLYLNFSKFIKNVEIDLLTSSTPKKEKDKIKEYTSIGVTKILIGTHAIIQDDVEFDDLTICMIDEQHRFGVEQRNKLIKKTNFGEFLYMSATPIPRTLAQSVFGVMDLETIKSKPTNRKPIITEVYTKKNKANIFKILNGELAQGNQAYVIAPTIEETEIEGLENVEDVHKSFQKYYNNQYKVGLLHGAMKSADKIKIMEKFKEKEYDILVATTVVEVGVDVPGATVMVIVNAERYGLAQLHQLRGRVGRDDKQGYCLLYDKSNNKVSKERLNILKETNNGEVLANEDMKLRGSGNFFGKEQSGLAGFKLFNLYEDQEIAEQVINEIENKNK